jgi:hypothetical protein
MSSPLRKSATTLPQWCSEIRRRSSVHFNTRLQDAVHVREGEECGLCVCGFVEVRRWVMGGFVSSSSKE